MSQAVETNCMMGPHNHVVRKKPQQGMVEGPALYLWGRPNAVLLSNPHMYGDRPNG